MKKVVFTFLLSISCLLLIGQNEIDSLVSRGIELHDQGNYPEAIKVYEQALRLDPNSTLVNYEMALTYMYAGDFEKAIEHSDIVINQNKDNLLGAYIAKGSCLDDLGRVDESIALFEKALDEFGDHYLLLFNLAINYTKINEYKKAEPLLIRAIKNNTGHASSHLMLSRIKGQQKARVQRLLPLFYFLFIEPNTPRAEEAYDELQAAFKGNVTVKETKPNKPKEVTINMEPSYMESEFSGAELIIETIDANHLSEKHEEKTAQELFIEKTKSFFTVLGELKGQKERSGIWWEFYVPFFSELAAQGHTEAFCYFISLSKDEGAREWMQANSEKMGKYIEWLKVAHDEFGV